MLNPATRATLSALCLCLQPIIATPIQWRVEDGGNGHWYELVGDYLNSSARWNWQESKAQAEAREHLGARGHLVTITSAAENQFLVDNFHVEQPWPAWLGLFLAAGEWQWVTGEPVSFGGWWPGSPDNWTGNEDAALMGSQWGDHHFWNDEFSGHHAAFFVEYGPVPVPDSGPFASAIALGCLLVIHQRWNGSA